MSQRWSSWVHAKVRSRDGPVPPVLLELVQRVAEGLVPAQSQAAGHLDVVEQRLALPVPSLDLQAFTSTIISS